MTLSKLPNLARSSPPRPVGGLSEKGHLHRAWHLRPPLQTSHPRRRATDPSAQPSPEDTFLCKHHPIPAGGSMCPLACSFLQALPRPPAPFAGSVFRGVIQESSHTHSLISTWRGLALRWGSSRPQGTTRAGSQEPTENDTSGHSSHCGHEVAGQEGCC